MNDEFKLDPICGDDKNHQDGLEDAYGKLYKSLGVEPGLLSKSSIGRKIEQKYHDDIDAHVYALSYMQNNKDKKDYNTEYVKQSPLAGTMNTIVTDESEIPDGDNVITLFGHKFYVREDNEDCINKFGKLTLPKKKLIDILAEYQIENNLSEDDMAKQIQEYFKKYSKSYFVGSY